MNKNFLLFLLTCALLVVLTIWLSASCSTTKSIAPPITESPTMPTDSTESEVAPTEANEPANGRVGHNEAAANATLQFYQGSVRRVAKTTICIAVMETFETVGALLSSLPNDADMRQHDPRLRDNSPRCAEETRNVIIPATYVFSIKKEADGDFHLMIGDLNADGEKINLMTVEISGLPPTNAVDFAALHGIRQKLYGRFPEFFQANGARNKLFIRPPYPTVRIGGSLFFDVRHQPGQMGGMLPPQSVWEIHPISTLTFH